MRKVFVDCGYNVGDLTEDAFVIHGPSCEYYAFEANKYLFEKYKDRHDFTQLRCAAVWIKDGFAPFHIVTHDREGNWDPHGGASSLNSEKAILNLKTFKHEEVVETATINFSKWISENFSKDDEIIVKMDIEGAEYDVLTKLINDGTASYINKLYIEFHDEKVTRASGNIIVGLMRAGIEVFAAHDSIMHLEGNALTLDRTQAQIDAGIDVKFEYEPMDDECEKRR